MTSSHLAILDRQTGVARFAALIGAGLGLVALALGVSIAVVNADSGGDVPRPANATVQRAAQTPPPARVILPAPWEQAAPAQSAAAPAKPADRR
ncbi:MULTISPECIES: hypothetical protein [Bradyrhizobium]|jgi:hypothetical protein|uniref:hypothetical protein n=1 Tax=Bradyrhizobium TaxID=374 RepID=UPI0004140708|nr:MULTISPECIES: hypothetical protein [Bradyrhizobium]KIU48642.1 hypothetical protein QU41_14135 [Bradyrhizobium elkanii]MBK5653941.1 hypothetical protein [Rhizobium sp.]OCX29360.1 hypothetical protein QU42_20900 [Bradyrhizobium sp. UASWS1016]